MSSNILPRSYFGDMTKEEMKAYLVELRCLCRSGTYSYTYYDIDQKIYQFLHVVSFYSCMWYNTSMNKTYYSFLIKEKARAELLFSKREKGSNAHAYVKSVLERIEIANTKSTEVEAWNFFRNL